MILYHGSHNKKSPVVAVGHSKEVSNNIFDGLFLSHSAAAAASHAQFVHAYVIEEDKIAARCDLEQEWGAVFEAVKKEISCDNDDIVTDIAQLVIDDAAAFDEVEEILEYLSCEQEVALGSWELQRIRGRVAAALGFDAIEMNDEHGTSYLLVNQKIQGKLQD